MPRDLHEQLLATYEFMLGRLPNRDAFKTALADTLADQEVRVILLCPLWGEIPYERFLRKAERAGLSEAWLQETVNHLVREGFLITYAQPDATGTTRAYPSPAAPLTGRGPSGRHVIGRGSILTVCEMQVRKHVDDTMRRASAALMNSMIEGGTEAIPTKTPYYRAIAQEPSLVADPVYGEATVDVEIPDPRTILPYDIVSHMVRQESIIAVAECYCRRTKIIAGEGCDHPMETCIYFNELALCQLETGRARRIDAEEAIDILRMSAAAGLVHNVSNCEGGISSICNCCSCSCGILRAHLRGKGGNAGAPSRFIAAFDESRCVACGACVAECPLDVLVIKEGTLAIDQERCIGCGICVARCPQGALHLDPRDKRPPVPKDGQSLMRRITFEALGGLVKRKILGR
jgi:NAD-dependent dihydropyrimidine dehydrogenase PreA subunit